MKKIIITGENSYIGTSFKKWLNKSNSNKYKIDTISIKDEKWKENDFSQYDVLFHVAGITHVSYNSRDKDKYYRVNYYLTKEVVQKAKRENIGQFIFMSSIIVYGDSSKINKEKTIDINTIPEPTNFYGDSKLKAEIAIKTLEDEKFKVVIIRSPMVYGKKCKGNYKKLSKLAKITPVFPDIKNQRSMIHIDNLCEFIKLMIDNNENGTFFPQNKEYINTSELVRLISEINGGKSIKLTKFFNPLIKIIGKRIIIINKIFGSLAYEKNLSEYKNEYRIVNLRESIEKTER